MAADEEHEREATEWIEGIGADIADEPPAPRRGRRHASSRPPSITMMLPVM